MPKLKRKGELLTVFTDYDCYEYLFDDVLEAREQAIEYMKFGCQTYIKTVYEID